ncbi:MAG: kinase [Lysobacterales bacterium]
MKKPIADTPLAIPNDFLQRHDLGEEFQSVIRACYQPILGWVRAELTGQSPLVIGINGAQGTGKSTLADFLAVALADHGVNAAVMSIDDFYLSSQDRAELAQDIHPLLRTRGVPGTHNVADAIRTLLELQTLEPGQSLAIPRFDKAFDEPQPDSQWPIVVGSVDVIIVEGWCVASQPQSPSQLREPVNELEREQDPDRLWRSFVNRQLEFRYSDLFSLLDRLVFLAAPDFDSVRRWRIEQEQKLRQSSPDNSSGIMSASQIEDFIQHYQRLTQHNLKTLPNFADVHVMFDQHHQCSNLIFRE